MKQQRHFGSATPARDALQTKELIADINRAQKIVPARDQRPGEDRIVDPGAVEYADLFLFSSPSLLSNSDL
jgi:hypothetical protein